MSANLSLSGEPRLYRGQNAFATRPIAVASIAANGSIKNELLGAVPGLRAFAVSLARDLDRADDLVQETLLKAWTGRAGYQPGTSMRAWLFTILRNAFYSQSRKD